MDGLCERSFHKHFLPRRTALLRAFTQELHLLVEKCDPKREPLCLYASSRGKWAVKQPEEYLPCTRPEHYIGVNKKMLEMNLMEWIRFVAMWSDAWLVRYTFYMGARLNAKKRAILFEKINNLNTLLEQIEIYYASEGIPQHVENLFNMRKTRAIGASKNNPIEIGGGTANSSDTRRDVESENSAEETTNSGDRRRDVESENSAEETTNSGDRRRDVESEKPNENHIVVEDNPLVQEKDETCCAKCNRLYQAGQFWILCDACDRWFHGRCVRVTKKQSEDIGFYKCPECRVKERSRKRRRE